MTRSFPALTFAALLALVLATTLTGCAQPPLPKESFYRLSVDAPAGTALPRTTLPGVLSVQVSGHGLVAGRAIVFAEAAAPNQLDSYHYHTWTEPPAIMLRDRLVAYLRAVNAATTVVVPEMRIEPDFVVIGQLKRLERMVGREGKAVVELELSLKSRADDRVIVLDSYRAEVATMGETVADAVAAMDRAVADIFARFAADIGRS